MSNVTHLLLVMGKDRMRLPFLQNAQGHSLTIGHKKQCDDLAAFHDVCNVTHLLLAIGKKVISQNVQCDSQAVYHKKRFSETTSHNNVQLTNYWL